MVFFLHPEALSSKSKKPHWWDPPIRNGRMEGINNKVNAMLRQHDGLRDERFFILRLLGLHQARFRLSGG